MCRLRFPLLAGARSFQKQLANLHINQHTRPMSTQPPLDPLERLAGGLFRKPTNDIIHPRLWGATALEQALPMFRKPVNQINQHHPRSLSTALDQQAGVLLRKQPMNQHNRVHRRLMSTQEPSGDSLEQGKKEKEDSLDQAKTSVMFTLPDHAGALSQALRFFHKHGVSLTRIESRPSRRSSDYEFYVDFAGKETDAPVVALLHDLRSSCPQVHILESYEVPWFPRKFRELDKIANMVMDAGTELKADHPGFHDPVYRERRKELAQIAMDYKSGRPIERVKYTKEELLVWETVWDKLTPLLHKHACKEYVRLLPLLVDNCGYRPDNIPQLQDICDFLKECTGFTIRPVAGLLSARNFLYGLAFRVFFSTQYIRHHARPLYTPEPDIIHELIGHAPLFADRKFADFSQEIGLASLGASDEQILQLSRCYWFSVEFGLCLQDGERKAYGAGLLSSFGELEYSMSDKPKVLPWDPFDAAKREYPICEYQPVYYQATSFEDAKLKMQQLTASFARCFGLRYDPYTQSVEVDRNLKVRKP